MCSVCACVGGVGELAEVGTYGGQRFGVQGLFQFPLCVCVCVRQSLSLT